MRRSSRGVSVGPAFPYGPLFSVDRLRIVFALRVGYHLTSVAVHTLKILRFIVISQEGGILSFLRIMSEGIGGTAG